MLTKKSIYNIADILIRDLLLHHLNEDIPIHLKALLQPSDNKKNEPDLITEETLRIKLRLKPDSPTLWRWRTEKPYPLPSIKKGKKVYYEFGEVVEWMKLKNKKGVKRVEGVGHGR